MSIDFIYHSSDSVSINIIHHSLHISQNNQKMLIKSIKHWLKNQSKHLMSIFIKISLILYTAEFYNLMSWLWLRVKRVADWMKCSIIHSKISQNSRAYEMKNTWFQSLIQYIMYWIKHVISSWHTKYFLNSKLHQHWSNWFSYACTWAFTHSQQLLWRH